MSKKMITIIMIIIIIMSIGSSVFATAGTDTALPTESTGTNTKVGETPNLFTTNKSGDIDPGIPAVSIDDVNEWTDRKGAQIIATIQRFAQPFTIVVLIGCAFLMLIGAFGDSRLISKGIYGMFISVIVYAVVVNANTIMDTLLGFLMN